MTHPIRRRRWLILATIALGVSILPSCVEDKIDFELTGTAYDEKTKQPIEGAYAVAIYKGIRAGYVAVRSHCVKTKGMYTGKDGKYHFPVEQRDGYSPWNVQVIHLDYEVESAVSKPDAIHHQQRAEAYTNRDAYMKKLDPAKPVFGGHDVWCTQATKQEDVVAAIEFMRLERAQGVKYTRAKGSLDVLDEMIARHEEIDERTPRPAIRVEAAPSKQ